MQVLFRGNLLANLIIFDTMSSGAAAHGGGLTGSKISVFADRSDSERRRK